MSSYEQQYHFTGLKDVEHFSEKFASLLLPGDVIALEGALGSGKTSFVQFVAKALQVHPLSQVTSPTFAYHQEYQGSVKIHHMDWYRIENDRKLIELDLTRFLEDDAISMIEWFSKFSHVWLFEKITVKLSHVQNQASARQIQLIAVGDRPVAVCRQLEKLCEC